VPISGIGALAGADPIIGVPMHQRNKPMVDAASIPTKVSRTSLSGYDKPKCRVIMPPMQGGWSEPALFEWELTAESWTDQHPHSEYNFVIEGELFVESGGVTLEAQSGDVVRVPAGAVGRYWAPKYARLLAIYGPSDGAPSKALGYEKLNSR
jgi:mannose-6-phosphate isomerase-like protein (cupin superfamily)